MTLRVRLTLYFSIIVLLPLTVAAVAARAALVQELESRTVGDLRLALQGVAEQVELVQLRAGDLAEDLAAPSRQLGPAIARGDATAVREAVAGAMGERGRVDLVLVVGADGRLLAERGTEPDFAPGVDVPTSRELAEEVELGTVPVWVVGELREVQDSAGVTLGAVLAGRWVDTRLVEELAGELPVELSLRVHGMPVAATNGGVGAAQLEEVLEVDGWSVAATTSVAPLQRARRLVTTVTIGILLVVGLTAAGLGWLVSQLVLGPIEELAAAARDVAGGDLSRRVEVDGSDELAVVGEAFNAMTDELARQVRELEVSRDALQHSLDRLGQTLSSTLDLNRTLSSVVDGAASALGAQRAALYMLAPGRSQLYVKVARGIATSYLDHTVDVGDGLVGWVAQTASVVRLPQDADEVPAPDALREPPADVTLAVPLYGPNHGQVIGVLVLYDRLEGEVFEESDLHTIRSFAAQASVAIENVRLHEATQQASVTDGLTGLWNVRYFQQRVDEEIERAARFGHEVALVLLDIDRFKSVNDRYGHLIGDQVLVEVGRRVVGEVREVDTVARYGGEEMVLVLPETGTSGARHTAERIRDAVASTPVVTDAGDIHVTVSLGVASAVGADASADGLLRAADRAMYTAKDRGRDRVEVADGLDHQPQV